MMATASSLVAIFGVLAPIGIVIRNAIILVTQIDHRSIIQPAKVAIADVPSSR